MKLQDHLYLAYFDVRIIRKKNSSKYFVKRYVLNKVRQVKNKKEAYAVYKVNVKAYRYYKMMHMILAEII